eukprot:gene3047-3326_t
MEMKKEKEELSEDDEEEEEDYEEEEFEEEDDNNHTEGASAQFTQSPNAIQTKETVAGGGGGGGEGEAGAGLTSSLSFSPSSSKMMDREDGAIPSPKKRVKTPGAVKKSVSIEAGSPLAKVPGSSILEEYLKGIDLNDGEDEAGESHPQKRKGGRKGAKIRGAAGASLSDTTAPSGGALVSHFPLPNGSVGSYDQQQPPQQPAIHPMRSTDGPIGEEEDEGETQSQAQRVEAFLMELFPERYVKNRQQGNNSKKKKSSSTTNNANNISSSSSSYNKNNIPISQQPPLPRPSFALPESRGDDLLPPSEDVLASLETQMKLLRKELKVKDDKIYRLKEHADLMAAHMDRLKGEVARLNAKLHQAEQELEAKESRLVEALKSRKKVSKKTNKESHNSGGGGGETTIAALEGENGRLREREAALMDAVEELSVQNADLILKLRESMQRELELSSKRAALVSHTILPSIYSKESHGGQGSLAQENAVMRSQSEPQDVSAAPRRGKKKRA